VLACVFGEMLNIFHEEQTGVGSKNVITTKWSSIGDNARPAAAIE
jgi:hypothetical protein